MTVPAHEKITEMIGVIPLILLNALSHRLGFTLSTRGSQ